MKPNKNYVSVSYLSKLFFTLVYINYFWGRIWVGFLWESRFLEVSSVLGSPWPVFGGVEVWWVVGNSWQLSSVEKSWKVVKSSEKQWNAEKSRNK